MQKIDRLGWAAGITVTAFGRRIGIRTDKPEVLSEIAAYLPPGSSVIDEPYVDHLYSLKVGGPGARPNSRHFTLLYSGLQRIARTMVLTEALDALREDLEQYVAVHAKDRVFLHAGVVGWRDKAIVLPGRTFAGKSTLVAALLQAGAIYYSDEFAVFDEGGHVYPFARPLAIRTPSGDSVSRHGPEQFGAGVGTVGLPVGVLAFLEYRKDAADRIREFAPSRAALQMVPYAFCATVQPERTVLTLATAVQNCRILRGRRGEASVTAERLLSLL